MKSSNLEKLYAKYGGEDHVKAPDEFKETAVEPEFFPTQKVGGAMDTDLTGLVGTKTKYQEDVYIGGHTSVWGSTFDTVEKRWGYKCCLSFDKGNERCTGEAGRNKVLAAREEVARKAREAKEEEDRQKQKELEEAEKSSSSDSDDSDSSSD